MTELSEEEQARVARLKLLCADIQSLLSREGFNKTDAMQTLCLLVAQLSVEEQNPDRAFLWCMDQALAVFRDLTNQRYRNQDPAVS